MVCSEQVSFTGESLINLKEVRLSLTTAPEHKNIRHLSFMWAWPALHHPLRCTPIIQNKQRLFGA